MPGGGGGCASANLQIGVNFLKIDIDDVFQTLSVDPTFGFFFLRVSLTEFIHMSMEKQNLDLKMYLCEVSGYKFHSVLY